MNKREKAIKGSIRKWERVCCDVFGQVGYAIQTCALCDLYLNKEEFVNECSDRCPLVEIGKGCLKDGSDYQRIYFLSDGDEKTEEWRCRMIDACSKMYESVCSLLPNYDPLLEGDMK